MGCSAPTNHRTLRRAERVPSIETWANSSSYIHPVDLSAFISASSEPLLPPPENPPPYTEQLLEGHITLLSGDKVMIDPANSFSINTDDNLANRSSSNTALASLERHIQHVAIADEGLVSDQVHAHNLDGQYRYMPMSSEHEPTALQVHGPAGAQCTSTPTSPPRPAIPHCTVGHNHAFGCPTSALPPSIQFHRYHHHRSLSENCTSLNNDQPDQPHEAPDNMPSIAHSVVKLPTAIASPFLPRMFLPLTHISQQSNIAQELRGDWIANDPFVRTPSRLPPLQRPSHPQREKGKQRLSHSWHLGSL